ncbi:MAG: aldehyde dehydrogenase family protein [bacterium]
MSFKGTITKEGKRYFVSINPATLDPIGELRIMEPEEISQKVDMAEKAFGTWSSLSIEERGNYLNVLKDQILKHFDDIADIISKEMGKPRIEAAIAEIMVVVNLIDYFVKKAPRLLADEVIPLYIAKVIKSSKINYRPYGPVVIISPWNYPFAIPMGSIVMALLAGNTVLFKPASDAILIGKKIEELINTINLPEGVFNFISAPGSAIGKSLIGPKIRKIVFTGSVQIGKQVMETASKYLIPVVLELGGKDPMIVCRDANIELAANGAVWGAFTNAGQVCASVERVYVMKEIADEFINKVVNKTKALRVGQDTDFNVDMGPMVNEGQLHIVEEHVEDARKKGATILTGGERIKELKGFFFPPTVLTNVNHTMKCMTEETFGPLLPIMVVNSEKEAIELANDTVYGLTASVWTKDRERGEEIAKQINAGTVTINEHAYTYGLPETPWGGIKDSGMGRTHSKIGLMEMVVPYHINIDHLPDSMNNRPWCYPYSNEKYEWFKNLISLFGTGVGSKIKNLAYSTKLLLNSETRRKIF